MTCIVAIREGQKVVLGGDSAGVGGHELRLRAAPKVFLAGSYAIGYTTSFRMGQILRYHAEFPEPPATGVEADELERFMVTEFVSAVRRAFVDHGFAKTLRSTARGANVAEEGQEAGGLFLVGVAGQIFEVREDYQIARPVKPYSAVGFGATVALGALYALDAAGDQPLRERAALALAASESYCAAVRRPFHFVEL